MLAAFKIMYFDIGNLLFDKNMVFEISDRTPALKKVARLFVFFRLAAWV